MHTMPRYRLNVFGRLELDAFLAQHHIEGDRIIRIPALYERWVALAERHQGSLLLYAHDAVDGVDTPWMVSAEGLTRITGAA